MSKNQRLIPLVEMKPFKENGETRYKEVRAPHLFVDPNTGIIYFEAKISGKRIKFSTQETNPIKAKRIANEELDKRLGRKTSHVRTLIIEELQAWLLFKESEGLKYDTLNNIKRAKRQIQPFWGKKLPSEINRDSFAEWCSWWKDHHPNIEMENAVKYFNNFCKYLHEKVVNDRPLLPSALRFKDPNRHEIEAQRALKKERVFSDEEFQKVYVTALNSTEALIIHFMYTMATRIDETLKLDFGGRILLDLELPVYRWTAGNNKARRIGEHALHSSLIDKMKVLRAQRQVEGTNLLFPQKNNNQVAISEQQVDWEAWRERAQVGWHWTPHTFRHTALTNLFNDPRNPQAVLCKQYRVSLDVALKTYVKVNRDAMLIVSKSIEVKL